MGLSIGFRVEGAFMLPFAGRALGVYGFGLRVHDFNRAWSGASGRLG